MFQIKLNTFFLIVVSCSTFVNIASAFNVTTICTAICDTPVKSSPLQDYCQQRNDTGHMETLHSCCVNNTQTGNQSIIGIDFSSCNLQKHGDRNELFNYLTNLEFLMLENNSALQLTDDAFKGLTILQNLSLPIDMNCPGGNRSWIQQDVYPDKVVCYQEINLCLDKNVTCPNNNSHCVFMGPGQLECLCNEGFYGYKCLRKGTFPSAVYVIALCVCTLVLAVVLWCLQRRKIKTH